MADLCTRCGGSVPTRTPSRGITHQIRLTKTTVSWRLRFSRFHWRWLPERASDRMQAFYSTLDLCDPCAGDVFLFAQGLPTRAGASSPQDANAGQASS